MNKKNTITNVLLIIVIVLVLGLFVFMVFGNNKPKEDKIVQDITDQQIVNKPEEKIIKKEDNTKNTNTVISQCGFSINSPALNSPIYSNTPLTFSGIINNTNSQSLGCSWTMFEGQAGTAQLYYKNGNTWGIINTAKIIKVTNWMTTGPVPFTVSVNFNNTGPGFSNNTLMKVVFTEENPSGATPDTLEFPLILKTNNQTPLSSFEVLSPNGGETYHAGQSLTVKWASQNLSSSFNDVVIALHQDGNWQNVVYLTIATINDGTETFVIPNTIIPGNYKIRVGSAVATIEQDFSDSLFTIN